MKVESSKTVFIIFIFVFLVWSFYRATFFLPEWLEELVIKPFVFLGPVFWLLKKEKKPLSSLGMTSKCLFKNIYLGLGLGMVFSLIGLLTNYLKYGSLSFINFGLTGSSLLWLMFLSLATAFSEEVFFRGYIFTRLLQAWKDELSAGLVSAFLFSLIHLPIAFFVWEYGPGMMLSQGLLSFLVGFGNAFLMARTQSIIAPTLNHSLWSLAVFLFR
jgi:membrane protease YdiL (CAAX protease family)